MGRVEIEHGLVKYIVDDEIYYVKQHSIRLSCPAAPPASSFHETFFNTGL